MVKKHHQAHIDTLKHKLKRELFEKELESLTIDHLENKYNSTVINDILNNYETIESEITPSKNNVSKI